jgi:transcriptional regulator with XRE-family HTH domain
MTTQSIDWAALLLEYRKNRGLKQAAVAKDFSVSQATISRWESGAAMPTSTVRRLLFKAARRERSPIDTLRWVEVFRRLRVPGAVITADRTFEVVTEPMAELLNMPLRELEGLAVGELFEGEILDVDASIVEAGLFAGHVVSVEGACRVDVNRRLRRGISLWMHHVGWPHFLEDGRIVHVGQSILISKEATAEIQGRLGGPVRITLMR